MCYLGPFSLKLINVGIDRSRGGYGVNRRRNKLLLGEDKSIVLGIYGAFCRV